MNKQARQSLWLILAFVSVPALGLLYVFLFENPTGNGHSPAEAYAQHCGNCHGAAGEGLRSLYPPLAGSDYLADHQEDLACIIRAGMSGPITVNGKEFDQPMPGLPELPADEVSRIINYINSSWGNDFPFQSEEEVRQKFRSCTPSQPKTQPRR